MILYVLGIMISIIILFFIFIRLKYRFWAIQPVFHYYDLYYWFCNTGIIRKELPSKNKYTNFKNIETKTFESLNTNELTKFIQLIQNNYLKEKENIFLPKKEQIVPYFTGHSFKSFFSFYYESILLYDGKNNTTINDKKMIGVITSRPISVFIKNGKNELNFYAYYVDYLCVDNMYRNKNIAPQIIQTHEYQQSHKNKKICISLFKREEELTGIIPLTVYKTYCFDTKKWHQPIGLNSHIHVLIGDNQNIYYFNNFIKEQANKWKVMCITDMSNMAELVTTKNIYLTMLLIENEIVGVYIFRKTCIYLKENHEILSCIASIKSDYLLENEFTQGFKVCLWKILENNINFQYVCIENISDNNYIIENICKKTNPLVVSPMAYFFYNFAYQPFKSNNILIIS